MGSGRADVNDGGEEPGQLLEKVFLGVVRDVVSLDQGEVGGHGDVGVGMQGVADPAQPQVSHLEDAVDRCDRGPGFVDQGGVDRVHQPRTDLGDRGPEHAEDRDGDQQPDDGVGPREPGRDT